MTCILLIYKPTEHFIEAEEAKIDAYSSVTALPSPLQYTTTDKLILVVSAPYKKRRQKTILRWRNPRNKLQMVKIVHPLPRGNMEPLKLGWVKLTATSAAYPSAHQDPEKDTITH